MKKISTIFACFFTLALFIACSSRAKPVTAAPKAAPADEPLNVGGKDLHLVAVKTLVSERQVTIQNTYEKKNISFVGFPLVQVLNATLGQGWKKQDGLLFTALDGYKMDISVAKVLKYNPILAYRYEDKQLAFSIDKKSAEGTVELSPYYLVWDNISHPELVKEGANDWPYQIAKIEPIQYSVHYAKVFPFANPGQKVKEGFEAYKNNCMACHALKDQGGLKAAQLWPYPAVVQMGRAKFSKWVVHPQSVKLGTTMPAFNPELSEPVKNALASKIYDYLAALHKLKPVK